MSTVPPEGTPDPTPDPSVPPPPYTAPSTPPPYQGAPPPTYGQPAYGAPAAPLSQNDERLWATLAHAGGIIFWFLAPLVIWLVFRERSRFVDDQAKEALNFQILVNIGLVASLILMAVLIGFITYPIIWVVGAVFSVMAAIAANRGELYRYPFNWRIVK